MGNGLVLGLAAAVTLLAVLCLWVGLLLAGSRRGNRELSQEVAALHARLEQLEEREAPPGRGSEVEYVITTAGLPELSRPGGGEVAQRPQIDARQFASVAVGESLVRIASLAYGVRRALSAENRNRIGFEVRREIRRARRQRRRDLKEARRHLRATQRDEDAA
jgi:hypothetical protein